MRINVVKTVVKDFLNVRLYLKFHRFFERRNFIKTIKNEQFSNFMTSLLSAWFSSLIIPVLLTPFDVIKTQSMCEVETKADAFYKKFWGPLSRVFFSRTPVDAYRGCTYGIANSAVHSTILLMLSHFYTKNEHFSFDQFLVFNAIGSSICYPLDTIT